MVTEIKLRYVRSVPERKIWRDIWYH